MHIQNRRLCRYCTKNAGDDHATQEKYSKRDSVIFANEAPDQTGRKEPIVETLIRSENSGLFSKLRSETERPQSCWFGPKKHLQNQDVQVLNCDKCD